MALVLLTNLFPLFLYFLNVLSIQNETFQIWKKEKLSLPKCYLSTWKCTETQKSTLLHLRYHPLLSGISVIRGFILFLNNLSIFTFFKTLSIRPILKPILELRLNDTWHVFWHLPLSLTRISVRHLLSKLQITLSNRCRCSRVTCQLFILPLVSATIVKAQIKSGEKSMHLYYRQKGNNFALRFSLCSIWVSTIHSKNAF